MSNWWENLLPREKMAVAAGALAVGLLLLYLLVQPLLSKRSKLRDEVVRGRTELAWMHEAAREIEQSGPAAPQGTATAPPMQLIDQAARENHLSDQLKRLEPGVNGEIKVWLNNANFVNLLHWLRQLSATGRLAVTNLNVEKGSAPGLVNAQLTLSSKEVP
ncbi:MAG: type II secretion system protein M [Desulfobulbaceae bacterium]|nr:type II secretion system protein M [Desulfobulbaceae bacterium]